MYLHISGRLKVIFSYSSGSGVPFKRQTGISQMKLIFFFFFLLNAKPSRGSFLCNCLPVKGLEVIPWQLMVLEVEQPKEMSK